MPPVVADGEGTLPVAHKQYYRCDGEVVDTRWCAFSGTITGLALIIRASVCVPYALELKWRH